MALLICCPLGKKTLAAQTFQLLLLHKLSILPIFHTPLAILSPLIIIICRAVIHFRIHQRKGSQITIQK